MKKYLIIGSFFCNLVFFGLTIRHFVLMPRKQKNPPLTFFAMGDKVLQALPKSAADVIFFGDTQFAAFRVEELFNSLRAKNRGLYYDSSRGIAARSADIAAGKPATVFIMCGINDLENEVALDTILRNVKTAVRNIKTMSPQTQLRILSVLPTSLKFGEDQHTIESDRLKLNKAVAAICKTEGIIFVNLDTDFLESGGLKPAYDVGDKIHVNGAGYKKLAEILKPLTGI